MPAATPVTTPVTEFTVATDVLLLPQVPPAVPLLVNGVDAPIHKVDAPNTVPPVGIAFTLITFVAPDVIQLLDTV